MEGNDVWFDVTLRVDVLALTVLTVLTVLTRLVIARYPPDHLLLCKAVLHASNTSLREQRFGLMLHIA